MSIKTGNLDRTQFLPVFTYNLVSNLNYI